MALPINSRGLPISVDERCWDLAKIFLPNDDDVFVADLAEDIQRVCEAAVEDGTERDRRRPTKPKPVSGEK